MNIATLVWPAFILMLDTNVYVHCCTYGSGPTCVFPCNCKLPSEVCDPVSGECQVSGCKDGPPEGFTWRGPGCRVGNVAYGKPAKQSGSSIDGSKAVDGLTTTSSSVYNIDRSQNAIWIVNLEGMYVITNVTLIAATSYQPYNVKVYVSNSSDYVNHKELCGTYPGTIPSNKAITIYCSTPHIAQYVTLKNGDHTEKYRMQMSEVVVMGYETADCSACAPGGCDSLTGCVACPVGKKQPDCRQDCLEKTYGVSCLEECHCRHGTCDRFSGICGSGCEDWWVLPTCSVYVPSPNMSHVTPRIAIQSPTSVMLHFQQLDIDEMIGEYYEYVAEYKTMDSEYIRADVFSQPHNKTSTTNTLMVGDLQPDRQYTIRIRPFRDIKTTEWRNEQRRSGAPSKEIHVKLGRWQMLEFLNCTMNATNITDAFGWYVPLESQEVSTGMVTGIASAVFVVSVIGCSLLVFFCSRRRFQNRAPRLPQDGVTTNPAYINEKERDEACRYEMHGKVTSEGDVYDDIKVSKE